MAPAIIDSPYWPGPNETQTDQDILETIKYITMTVWHASYTNKMGMVNDTMAVVDSKARVIGVERLRVVDASAFPLLPPGHPLSTIYALAEKIADDIKRVSAPCIITTLNLRHGRTNIGSQVPFQPNKVPDVLRNHMEFSCAKAFSQP